MRERRYPGLTRGQEEAAAIVLPNSFQDNWFHNGVNMASEGEIRFLLEKELEVMVPMVCDMDPGQRDMLVLALGAGLP